MRRERNRIEEINEAIEDYGGYLRDYRLKHHLSLEGMSQLLGCSSSYIWRVENHKRTPALDTKLRMLIAIWSIQDIHVFLQEIADRQKSKM